MAMYLNDTRAGVYRWLVMPLVHATMDPEDAHKMAIWLGKHHLTPKDHEADSPLLEMTIWGKKLSNPVGLAAGFDKNGEAIDAMFDIGFGAVEIGSITPLPQPGNPKPRMFRLQEDGAVINRYGFNSDGHASVEFRLKDRLRRYAHQHRQVSSDQDSVKTAPSTFANSLHERKLLGINLGKNKLSPASSNEDYVRGVQDLGPFADYLVVNISSPNTPGLRALQRREPIEKLLVQAKFARDEYLPHRPPLLVKIAPDLSDSEIEDISIVARNVGIDGIIIGNTTISRPPHLLSDKRLTTETGGLSGPPAHPLSLAVLRKIYALTDGQIPLIGCGGIRSAAEAIAFAKAGASMVQLYTGMAFAGPGLISEIKHDIVEELQRERTNWASIVGSDHRQLPA
ncbi:Dihydroorotate dehydrogenase [Phlyctochytrium arcticum]|nr:Dihydroorotate dehydrogenase [Phlyctochytrium arcticum]